ncbi:hypothetical protein GCM10020000_80150 [Streptomyces olivoverticillatus]
MKELPVRAARWSALNPWRAITGWMVFVVLCLGVGIAVGTHNATTEDYRVGEASRAEAMASEGHLQRKPVEQVLVSAKSGALDRQAAESAARAVAARMRKLPEVEGVAEPRTSGSGKVLMVQVTMRGGRSWMHASTSVRCARKPPQCRRPIRICWWRRPGAPPSARAWTLSAAVTWRSPRRSPCRSP